MKHNVFGRKLSRTKNERKRLLHGLVRDLIINDSIVTTLAKAKAVQPMAEKLITSAKKDTQAGMIKVRSILRKRELVNKFMDDVKNRFSSRDSGYTRILHLDTRSGDNARMAMFSFTDPKIEIVETKVKSNENKGKSKKVKDIKAVIHEKKLPVKKSRKSK